MDEKEFLKRKIFLKTQHIELIQMEIEELQKCLDELETKQND